MVWAGKQWVGIPKGNLPGPYFALPKGLAVSTAQADGRSHAATRGLRGLGMERLAAACSSVVFCLDFTK